jgi:PAS domain S-box-containing protein
VVVGIGRDITERKKAEEALKKSERKYRELFNSMTEAFQLVEIVFDKNGQAVDWIYRDFNPIVEKILGKSREQLINKRAKQLLGFVEPYWLELFYRVAKTGVAENFENYGQATDKWYSLYAWKAGENLTAALAADITEHKKAETALKASEARLNSIFTNSLDAILLTAPDGRIFRANPTAQRMLGMTEREIIEAGRQGIVVPDQRLAKAIKERMETGKTTTELTIRRKDGSTLPIEVTSSLFVDSDGSTKTSMIFRDITERKKAEEALRKSEERFRTVFEKTALGIVIGDMEGHVVECNSALGLMLGYSVEELKGKLFSEFTYPADANLEWPLIRDLMAGKCDKYEIEKRYIRKDGEIIWVHLTGNIIFGRNKEPLIGVATIEDITERRKAEEELKKSEARLRLIAQAGRIGFFEYNVSKDIAYWSPEHYELLGYESGSVISWDRWLVGVHPEDRERVMANYVRLMERGRSEGHVQGHKDEYRFIRPDGSIVWIESDLSLSIVNNEAIIRGSIRDITERKKAEEKLAYSALLLENVSEAIIGTDPNFCITGWSKGAERIYGYSAKEAIGKTISELIKTEYPNQDRERILREFLSEGSWKGEVKQRTKEGKYIYIASAVSLIKNSKGEITATVAVNRTQRKKAEEALRQSQELISKQLEEIKSYYDNAPVGLAILDRDLRYIRVNNRFAEINGMPAEEHIGKTVREVVPTLAEQAEELPRKIIKSGEAVRNIEFIGETAACPGEKRTWLESWIPIKDSSGEVTALYVMAEDITERKKAEEALKESEFLYRTLFDNTEDGFALVEPIFDAKGESDDYRIIQVNKTWERQTGTEANFIMGKRIKEVMPNTEPVWAAKYTKIVKTGKADHFEEYNQFTNRWYDVYAFPYKQGKVGLLFRDVTARKEMEKHLQDKERLAAIGATAGMVGHDIRNPLQAITGDFYFAKTELAELPDTSKRKCDGKLG